jgi:hypothetical protein
VLVRGYGDDLTSDFIAFPNRYVAIGVKDRLVFSVHHAFNAQGTTAGYYYQVGDDKGRELIAFHWHPGRRNQPEFPHLHIDGSPGPVAVVKKNHIPTGRVSLESVVRFLIAELDVRPLRDDWDSVLDEGERTFTARRTW